MQAFGEALLKFRRAAHLTQEELAEAAGLTARSIRDLERGRRDRPQRRTVQMLVAALRLEGADAAALLTAGRSGPPAPSATSGEETRAALAERTDQLAVLARAAREARAGQGTVVLVRADAGMGKTSLLNAWAADEQEQGLRVVRASGAELEQDFAFSVVRQLAEPLLARTDDAGRERLLSGPAEPASHALRVEGTGGGEEGLSAESTLSVLHSLYWLMVHVTDDGPLALVIDDVHWADGPSVRWLEYVVRRLRSLPLMVVLAARAGTGSEAQPLLQRIAAQPHCRKIGLPALTADGVAPMVRTALGHDADPQFVSACTAATQGNPLLLRELLRTLADHAVTPSAEHASRVAEFQGQILTVTVVERLGSQPEAVRQLARSLVVLEDGVAWHIAAELAGLAEAEAKEQGHRLQRIGVLAPGDVPRFDHPLIRRAITDAVMGPVELATGHARAAELLKREGAAGDRVATHLLLAEPSGEQWRVDTLREAARLTRSRGAPATTVTYLRRALREPMTVAQQGPLLLELGAAEALVDDTAAMHHLTQALSTLTDPYARAQAAHVLAGVLFVGGHEHARAVDVLARAVEELHQADDGTGLGREVSWYLQAQMLLIGYEDMSTLAAARKHAEKLRAYDLPGDTPGECAVLAALSAAAVTGDASAAVTNDLLDRALRGGIAVRDGAEMLVSLAGMGFVTTDRLDDAAARFAQVASLGERWGSFRLVSASMMWQLTVRTRRGQQVGLTLDFGHPGQEAAGGLERRVGLGMTALVGESLIERCEWALATEALAAEAESGHAGWLWQGPTLLVRSRLLAERGEHSAALAVLLDYGAQERYAHVTNLAMMPWRSQAATCLLALGRQREARELATEEVELAHRWGTDRAIGTALRCLGVVTGGREGLALLEEAVTTLERSPARLELARTWYELGASLMRTGESDRGRRALSEALELADTCGSVLLAGRVRRALNAAGIRPRPSPPVTAALSVTEHQMLEMVRSGHSDRKIAQSLLLTDHEATELLARLRRTSWVISRVDTTAMANARTLAPTNGAGPEAFRAL
ncbi:AAA family ATPase [Streptomyces sp. NPDC006314]|uniref:ATP-binding protein n=1 Tax=Streptomyces sp. NPDC006314 TaxID=3154475 RepID=UPI0033B819CE